MNFKSKVVDLWQASGSKKWNYEQTLKACIEADKFFRSINENPVKEFRKNLESNDEAYLRQWVMGCHFDWLNPRS